MATDLQKFQFKSKFMRKWNDGIISIILLNFICCVLVSIVFCAEECKDCQNGICREGICECFPGWTGKHCHFCTGRVRLQNESGFITEGSGNYSEDNNCTWLIDPGRPNSFIRLYFDHFATECSWDHLYIYDGDSIYDPLLAVFSGMVVQDHLPKTTIPEIVLKSGKALLYFYSDSAYNLTGFSISYRVDGCPSLDANKECSGNGVCLDGECTCNGGWSGSSCSHQLCPGNCSGHGKCNMERHRCFCHSGYTGHDCSQEMEEGWWRVAPSGSDRNFTSISDLERASHTAVSIADEVWIMGGYSFSPKPFILAKNISDGIVRRVNSIQNSNPDLRYGHSAVVYNNSIYMYGGSKLDSFETNDLWKFEPNDRIWTLIKVKSTPNGHKNIKSPEKGHRRHSSNENKVETEERKDNSKDEELDDNDSDHVSCLFMSNEGCAPVACVGHAAVVVKDMLLIIFGHSSLYGPFNFVQKYNFKLNEWKLVKGKGALVEGTHGHSAVWDPKTSLVYIYGGLRSASTNGVAADLITYNPFTEEWNLKMPAPVARFLHSAVLAPGGMLVFGGNTHNDTAFSHGAKCYSADFLFYDFYCNSWHNLKHVPDLNTDVARYGHSAVMVGGTMIVVAGFNGRMLGTVLHYHPGKCEIYTSKKTCLEAHPGQKCIWNRVLERCEIVETQDKTAHDFCPSVSSNKKGNFTALCTSLTSCQSCLHNSFGCVWCGNKCIYEKCSDYKRVLSAESCKDRKRHWCGTMKSCELCHIYRRECNWSKMDKLCAYLPANSTGSPSTETPSSLDHPSSSFSTLEDMPVEAYSSTTVVPYSQLNPSSCPVSCSLRTDCANCTQAHCIWCFNQQKCVSNNSYLVSFPYGLCQEWTNKAHKCLYIENGLTKCQVHQSCHRCQNDVGCGWCDDGSNTGTGFCIEGGQSGPVNIGGILPANSKKCPNSQWFFTDCPACNCNGHSHCVNDTCVMPCANSTRGRHCNKCKSSFFGDPTNGGMCRPCQCNDHGHTCEHDTGVCHCHTKGVTGKTCNKCDTQNNYYGEPLKGSCFYDLQIDYQFTFNLSKQEDIHIRQINFYNQPSKPEVDTDFDIQCSKPARIKLSAKQTEGHETWIIKNFTGTTIKRRFSASDYIFGAAENNTTFHVYVFNFTPPIEIIISFSQHPKLDLIQFFSIFSLCFMVLLLMAFVMWKIKQKYDLYTRRQRLMVEMEAMASRPFRSVFLELQLNDCDDFKSSAQESSCESSTKETSGGGTSSSEDSSPLKSFENAPYTLIAQADTKDISTDAKGHSLNSKDISTVAKDHSVHNKNNSLGTKDISLVIENASKTKGGLTNRVVKKSDNKSASSKMSLDNHVSNNAVNGSLQRTSCNGTINSVHPEMLLRVADNPLIKKKNNPSPVALEPCSGGMAAVLSMLVQLPTGGAKYTPLGHPGGLAIASALVSLGPPRSVESPPAPTKDQIKGKGKNPTRSHDSRI